MKNTPQTHLLKKHNMDLETPPSRPTFRIKLLFWVLLGVFSVILAEVVSGSSPTAFIDAWGLLAVFPLYTLHSLALAFIIFRQKRVSMSSLFLAGMIFGLYEAYITKVLWSPTWGNPGPMLGGVGLIQTTVLVFFWHPWMAFILPLLAAEQILSNSSEVWTALPSWLRPRVETRRQRVWSFAGFVFFCACYQGLNAPSAGMVLISDLQAAVVLGLLLWLWTRLTHFQNYSLRQLLPAGRQAVVVIVLLLLLYLAQGIIVRPEALPHTLGPYLTIWGLYLLAGGLLAAHLWKSPPAVRDETPRTQAIPWKGLLVYWLVLAGCASLLTILKPVAMAGVIASWAIGVLLGLFLLFRSAWKLARPDPASSNS